MNVWRKHLFTDHRTISSHRLLRFSQTTINIRVLLKLQTISSSRLNMVSLSRANKYAAKLITTCVYHSSFGARIFATFPYPLPRHCLHVCHHHKHKAQFKADDARVSYVYSYIQVSTSLYKCLLRWQYILTWWTRTTTAPQCSWLIVRVITTILLTGTMHIVIQVCVVWLVPCFPKVDLVCLDEL